MGKVKRNSAVVCLGITAAGKYLKEVVVTKVIVTFGYVVRMCDVILGCSMLSWMHIQL